MNKRIFAMVSFLVVAGMIDAAVSNKEGMKALKTTKRPVDQLCESSADKELCKSSLASASSATDPGQVVKASFMVAKGALLDGIQKSATIKALKDDPRSAQALQICSEVMTYALNDIEKSVNSTGKLDNAGDINQFMEDLKVWMGGVLTYQDVCFDAFEGAKDTEPGLKMREFFNSSRALTSNALAMTDQAKTLLAALDIKSLFGRRRRRMLLEKDEDAASGSQIQAGELPPWVKDAQRNLLVRPIAEIKPDAVVALDGSGQFKSVVEALAKNPNVPNKPYIVYVKAGIYKEAVTVDKKQNNVVLIGDGPTKTIITGNKNFVDGTPTFKTSTVGVLGDGFMARDMGFENSAGAEKHQAVALKAVGDYAVFHNCHFDAHQDTLYSVRGRHFYRDCTVKGTIDFIFGDAQVVFQNCEMVVKKPMQSQACLVTAQGRADPNGPGATIFQNCSIVADPAFTPDVRATSKAYLGRPWRPYSRTIIMQSNIDDIIDPEGWKSWSGDANTDKLFYAEFGNRGPGSALDKRVTWPGIKKLTPEDAQKFTPDVFYKGSDWIPPTGAPYTGGMLTGPGL